MNASWDAIEPLAGTNTDGARIHVVQLPCLFGASRRVLRAALRQTQPDLVLSLGLAGSRAEITPERVAVNIDDARIPDNAAASPVDESIVAGGPVAYWSTLPIKAITGALRAAGIPAAVSQTAGTFVCNHVFYALMHALAHTRRRPRPRGGFMHVPPAATSDSVHGLPLETITQAVRIAIETSLRQAKDTRITGGTID